MKYRAKPIVIEAFKFRVDNIPDWFMDKMCSNEIITSKDTCKINTLEGEMIGKRGDWIIRGTEGEIYPCKDVVFKKKYEPVGDDEK